MVETQGKMDKKVPTLFTADMIQAIDLLNKTRGICGIKSTNNYIFANMEDGHLSSWQVLNGLAIKAGCQKPELINSVTLRKYIATVCQVLDLNKGELHWLSSHLAHTVKTHKDFYRLQEAAVEIGKVSKLLLATENGTLAKYKGKSLNDIQIDDSDLGCLNNEHDEEDEDVLETTDDDPLDMELCSGITPDEDGNPAQNPTCNSDSDSNMETPLRRKRSTDHTTGSCPSKSIKKLRLPVVSYKQSDEQLDDSDGDPTFNPIHNNDSDSEMEMEIQPQMPPKRKKRWTEEENIIFRNYFRDYITRKTLPSGNIIKKVQTKLNRSVAQIRTRIHNVITGKQVV